MSQYLFLLREMVRRDFQARYAGSLFGFLWSFAQPLWLLVLFTFVFSTVMKMSLLGERTDSFAVFLFCGLLPWTAMHEGISRGTVAITDNASLVKKMRFPAELLVLAVVLTALLHQGIAALVFVGVLAATGHLPGAGLPMLLVAIPLQVALTLGVAMLLACVHVYFRDMAQGLGLMLNTWFYLTPIVYPMSFVPVEYQVWIELNPLTSLVEIYRVAFLADGPAWVPGTWMLAFSALLLLGFGVGLFRRLKPRFVDEI